VKGHILATDDDPNLRELYAQALTEAGHEVATASNAATALELVRAESFDVVLTDIHMPGSSGVDFLRAVRQRDPDLPFILITGSPTLETALEALEHGAVQYLVKPVRASAIQAAVARALRLRRIATLKREALAYLTTHERIAGDGAAQNASLSHALGSLWMAYQPIVNAADGRIFGHEALLRTAERSLPHAGAVLDAAERLGRIAEVGRAVRESVARSVISDFGNTFVNIHALELADDSLFSPEAPLSKKASQVILEITERAALDAIPDSRSRIRTLREMGYRIAIDDLGAGYAGLQSFALLEPDIVKLDMSLVRGVEGTPVKQKLIASMAALCRDLGILVVAEGIETEAERDAVIELGCDLLQGYLFGRPREGAVLETARGSPDRVAETPANLSPGHTSPPRVALAPTV